MSRESWAYFFRCPKCEKVFRKWPKEIGNTLYYPGSVTHKHGKITWYCENISIDEFRRLQDEK